MTYDEIQLLNMYRKLSESDKRVTLKMMEFEVLMDTFVNENNGDFDKDKFEVYKHEYYSTNEDKKTKLQLIK